jgi:glycosyltransferase involved in cell wall biosynthesis
LANHVVAVSEKIKSEIVRIGGATENGVTVVPNGVNIDHFSRENFGTDHTQEGLVIFTGNLAPYQGIDLLLKAMVELRRRRPDARLRIVTEDTADWPAAMARELGVAEGVELVRKGFDEVPGELANARVAVSPRIDCDGVPQKILNYMAAGKATVAFEGSARHIKDGLNGLIVPNGDVGALAHAILKLLDAPREAEKMGRIARDFVRQELSWTHTAVQIEQVYSKVVTTRDNDAIGESAYSWIETENGFR